MSNLSPEFWREHFEQGRTPWDRGGISPQLLLWLENGNMTPCRIGIPGCGKGWEVAELARRGFTVTGIDYTQTAINEAQNRLLESQTCAELVHADVLTYTPSKKFDAVYEQTCLCALDPDYWVIYAERLASWIRPGGSLYFLMMQVNRPAAHEGLKQGPPFHCDINAMHALFNSRYWQWPNSLPTVVQHPSGWHELATNLVRK